jgi:hypothetical protein
VSVVFKGVRACTLIICVVTWCGTLPHHLYNYAALLTSAAPRLSDALSMRKCIAIIGGIPRIIVRRLKFSNHIPLYALVLTVPSKAYVIARTLYIYWMASRWKVFEKLLVSAWHMYQYGYESTYEEHCMPTTQHKSMLMLTTLACISTILCPTFNTFNCSFCQHTTRLFLYAWNWICKSTWTRHLIYYPPVI